MVSFMKKTFAIVIAVALTFCCITVNAKTAAPSIALSNATVTAAGDTAQLTLTGSNFTGVAGADFTITIPEGLTYSSISNQTNLPTFKVSDDGSTIRFVDVMKTAAFSATLNVTVDADATGSAYQVAISDVTLVDGKENVVHSVEITNGNISLETIQVPESGNIELTETSEYFVPYGGIHYYNDADSTNIFLDKNEDGSFKKGDNTPANVAVDYFKLPDPSIGITTFASSLRSGTKDATELYMRPAIQFGSYVTDTTDKGTFGTLVIIGNFEGFKAAYTNYTESQLLARLAALYKTSIEDSATDVNYEATKKMKIKFNGDTDSISVGRITRNTYMWRGNNNQLQYALRVYDYIENTNYSAVGYSVKDGIYNFSAEVNSCHTD